MSRARFSLSLLAAATLAGCSNYTSPSNPPGGGGMQAANGISIVLGAQSKGTAAFSPNPRTISLASATGGLVIWTNNDQNGGVYGGTGVTHNITADNGSFTSGNLLPGATFETTLAGPGDYPYHCSIHPTMKGTVTVTP
ncbi:MAG TPA: plastocyanin/azurin family copper-binding protein [Gemmatimonadales bacterium]|nr:plastocyanin/azurin family copper-binding protein [Gemmatimonadales bacterium]